MNSEQIRKAFLDFFEKRGHKVVPSSSLIPDDPSVLLTSAGMQQFKRYFTGEADPEKDFGSKNTVSIQKSFRTSDIDEVGDESHLTFFEMLGNFTFGGYSKKEAITYAFDFITKEMQLPISYVTIFEGSDVVSKDEESRGIWNILGITDVREENMGEVFWGPTGLSGPCGPTTEIFCKNANGQDVEVWNIVFNQYFFPGSRDELLSGAPDKKLEPLKTFGVDTGMGFERLVMIVQGASSLFETDLLKPLASKIKELAPKLDERTQRIFTDHIRGITFLISDGLRPSNKEVGYVLRRLLRRILGLQIKYDVHANLFPELLEVISKKYSPFYPELKDVKRISEIIEDERLKFQKVIKQGVFEIERSAERKEKIDSKKAFYLYETFGLPFELTKELAPPSLTKDLKKGEFDKEFEKHQEVSRAGMEKKFGGHGLVLDTGELKAGDEEELRKVTRLHTATHLLNQALREVLGLNVEQRGSDITTERTRFDFTFPRKMTKEEIEEVEKLVNAKIKEDLPVNFKEMPKEEAEKTGALRFFKGKYPDTVKVYYIGKSLEDAWSKEFCGGPHVTHTGEIDKFRIIKEQASSAGVRRIRATVE